MILEQEQFITRIAETTALNTQSIERSLRQRRNEAVDLQGLEYTRQGDKGYPATFYLSISPDMVYMERFEFKLIIQPFVSTAGVSTNVTELEIGKTRLTISDDKITPNPHTHELTKHSHTMSNGIVTTPTTASDFRLSMEDIDITAYLMAQHGWINGEGIYPSIDLNKNYDILEVASDMCAAGKKTQADKLVKSGYKKVSISSGSPFSVTLVLYSKFSHANR